MATVTKHPGYVETIAHPGSVDLHLTEREYQVLTAIVRATSHIKAVHDLVNERGVRNEYNELSALWFGLADKGGLDVFEVETAMRNRKDLDF